MINRRVLRIKTMQSIYAYRVLRQAIYELSKEHLIAYFEPNYMAKVPEDRKQLKKEENLAMASFNEWVKDNNYNYQDKPEKVANAVSDALTYYQDFLKKDKERLKRKLILEIEEIYDSYIKILAVGAYLMRIAADNNENNLANNKVLQSLENNIELKKELNNRGINWDEHTTVLRKFFKNFLVNETEYASYRSLKSTSFEEDKHMALHIFKKMLFENEILDSHFEEMDLYWAENKTILKGMVKKTIKDLLEDSDENVILLDLSSNWEDDKDFISDLFDSILEKEDLSIELITEKSKNWEIDRLALTDKIILNMGIAEMINFPNIPVKVTINEYIEISKSYSTPQSKQFVNGMLDNISIELINNGTIKKSGRGLIDNKL